MLKPLFNKNSFRDPFNRLSVHQEEVLHHVYVNDWAATVLGPKEVARGWGRRTSTDFSWVPTENHKSVQHLAVKAPDQVVNGKMLR